MKNILLSLSASALLLSGCATLEANGYTTTVNDVSVQEQKSKGFSKTEIGLMILGAGAITYMGLSTGNKNKTPQSVIDARDACRAAAQTEEEWQSC